MSNTEMIKALEELVELYEALHRVMAGIIVSMSGALVRRGLDIKGADDAVDKAMRLQEVIHATRAKVEALKEAAAAPGEEVHR